MKSVPKRRYTAEFKAQAVGLVDVGRPVKEVAKDFGIGEGVLYAWVSQSKGSQAAQVGSAGQGVPPLRDALSEADELRRLRRENAHLKLENDILKKAAVILGTKPQPTDER
jgi:transposase